MAEGYPPGWQVRYRGRGERAGASRERIGTIAGPTLRDEHTSTTWVRVRPFCATPDTPLRLIRATDILDARPPGEPIPPTPLAPLVPPAAPAGEVDEHGTVVVELPSRGPAT